VRAVLTAPVDSCRLVRPHDVGGEEKIGVGSAFL